jgi:hypothetical protein
MVSLTGASLLSYYQGQAAATLLGSSAANTSNSVTALSNYYLAKEGINSSSSSSAAANAPAAPWSTGDTPSVSTAVQNALDGQTLIDPSASTLSAPAGSSAQDYKNLFALYQGLNTLEDLAQTASTTSSTSAPTISTAQLQTAFASGMSQVNSFLNSSPFQAFNMVPGKVSTSEQSTVGVANGASQSFTTGVIYTGDSASAVPAFQGDVQFTVSVASKYAPAGTAPTDVNIDLSGMGTATRTMNNVVSYINQQLNAAGVFSTFSVASLGNATVNTFVNGQATTTTGQPQFGLRINTAAGESISLSAPSTAAAVYVAEGAGGAKTISSTGTPTTTATSQQLIGLQTANSAVGSPPSTTSVSSINTNLPTGGVFSTALPTGVTSVQASATGSDGSVYMLANVTGSVSGAPVPGTQGVALLKYSSTGNLLYTKVLADGADASGYSLAVNSDGSVAVAGTNTTAASTALSGVTTPAITTAFVQVFDPTGAPSWSATVPASSGTTTASGVTFGSDGSVYLTGTTTGSVGNQPQQGTSDEYIQGFSSTGTATFSTQYGAAGGDNTSSGIVYDATNNTLYTAGSENSQAVVRSFALNGVNEPTAGATRTLGNATGVVGIGLSGDQLLIGGNVAAPTIHTSTVSQAFTGVADSFVASISTSLTPSSTDNVSYVGLSGATQTATAMAVAGDQAYLTGTIANDPSSLSSSGATEGFVAGVDASSGAVTYSDRFTAAGGQAAPTAISASATGSSVLNQLGLPTGQIDAAGSTLITANTPIKAGDSFYIRTQPGGPQTTITVSSTDTLTTLATKINSALGSAGTATVVPLGATSELSITPTNSSSFIELDSEPANAGLASVTSNSTDVLASLGLSSGVIRTVATTNGLTDPSQLLEYGLNLSSSLNLSTQADAKQAATALQAAIGVVQQAYQSLVSPPTLASEQAAKAQSGTAPAYLTAELANYQAGLSRLTAGSSTSSSASVSSLI